jgi:hypothetical protein
MSILYWIWIIIRINKDDSRLTIKYKKIIVLVFFSSHSFFRFLFHNSEINPDEFELLSELMNMVGVWFFEDIHILVFHYFLKQKVY